MIQDIVAFALRITRLEDQLTWSQNRSQTEHQQVAATLQQRAYPMSRDVGTLIQRRQATRRT